MGNMTITEHPNCPWNHRKTFYKTKPSPQVTAPGYVVSESLLKNHVLFFPPQNNPNMSNMGYGGDGVPAGAMTPGHHSMGAPTPYRSEIDEVRILAPHHC